MVDRLGYNTPCFPMKILKKILLQNVTYKIHNFPQDELKPE